MKRLVFAVVIAMGLACPMMANAQVNTRWYMGPPSDADTRDPYQYRDVDNAQILQLVAYAMTPAGMVLEWGLTRPLHYLATQTPLAPALSGDIDYYFFGQNNNADLVPPGTFNPSPMNLSNTFQPAGPEPVSHIEDVMANPARPGQAAMH
ncbi:MAG TPA: hypothetical protein VMT61_10840 [Candidatus Binataceae bacterium]|nr:hypothetical protein [Candidatus Binataceae bacterium]